MTIRVFLSLPVLTFLLSPAIQPITSGQKSTADAIPSKSSAETSLAENFGNLPLSFEVNRGQSDPSVKFLSHGNGYSLFLTDSAAVLELAKHEQNPNRPSGHNYVIEDVVRMELPGAKSNLHVVGAEQLPGKTNYFIGNDPSKWHSSISTYGKVRYSGVYPGIDLVYYGNQGTLEYDFVVSANADPKPLRLHFQGAQRLSVTRSGDLTIRARHGEIAFHKPVVYQMKDGVREPVDGRFRLVDAITVGFALGRYDHDRALVIDPALAYSTYLGGSGGDSGNAIVVDGAGDIFVVGGTQSPDFPVTADAFQKKNVAMEYPDGQPVGNAFISKFNPRGSALIYSTYLGGTTFNEAVPGDYSGDVATGIVIDAAGDAYVTGYTSAYNFPVTSNAFQKVNHANLGGPLSSNAFVTKLNPTGSALIYSTYFGGSGGYLQAGDLYYGESAVGIAVDAAGNAYIAGTARSTDLPVTSNAYQKVNHAGWDGFNLFITKFNSAGSGLIYSTYLGGSGFFDGRELDADTAGGFVIDSAGDAYVTGTAYSSDFPVTADAYQKVNNANHSPQWSGSNAIVTELNPTGSALVYSTYLGGSDSDGGDSIALDAAGYAYVAGYATSPDFPTTPGAFQRMLEINSQGYGEDIFVTKFDPSFSALVYSTFLGGHGGDVANSIALDAFDSAYVTGSTHSTDFPVTSDAFRKANHSSGGGNVFVSKLDPTGSSLLYSSYLGGGATQGGGYGDSGNGIAVDWFGDAYIAGTTCSTDFPLAGVPFQTKNKGTGCTAFMSKFIVNTVIGTTLVSNSNPGKVGATATFTATVTPNMGTTIPKGSVVFSLDGAPQVRVPLNGSGQATYSNSSLAAGRYTVTATYLGNATTSGSIANLGQLIIGAPARITVASGTYQTAVEGSPFAMPLVVLVQDSRGVPVPGAVVDFSGTGLSFSGNPAVTNADGNASVMATPTATGSLTATANTASVSIPAIFKLTATQPAP